MAAIHILDHNTIDQIAAGEVIERPASIVKELVENSIDAEATSITVEIRDGGIQFIRVSDNGCGIEKKEISKAFLRHATSKIQTAQDLMHVSSLGFRGEALSSIAAVSRIELITKTKDEMSAMHIMMEGPTETDCEEIGAPDGTTVIVRNLFFNVPVRKKFLKQPGTETGYITELMEHLALSNPQISFQFIVNKQVKFSTPGNGNLKQIIHSIYGREFTDSILDIDAEQDGIKLYGYLGKPSLNRSTRNFEIYFLNRRFIKSTMISRAIEKGYQGYMMQHKYPSCFIFLEIAPELVDVNVHPTKMDVRFFDDSLIYDFIVHCVQDVLKNHELIPEVILENQTEKPMTNEPILMPMQHLPMDEKVQVPRPSFTSKDFSISFDDEEELADVSNTQGEQSTYTSDAAEVRKNKVCEKEDYNTKEPPTKPITDVLQMNLFEEKFLTESNRDRIQLIGQIFHTYWLMIYEDKFYMVDQHAAHEKVKYERLIKAQCENKLLTQNIYPSLVISLTQKEMEVLHQYESDFHKLGFTWECFGGTDIALRSAPVELYGSTMKEMFLEIMDELNAYGIGKAKSVNERLASMACKAAVKGNMKLSKPEMESLLNELMTLQNPYYCPHGRPTMIYFTKQEIEKKFRRIV